MRICSLHFKKEDYEGLDRPGLKKRYLKETAVPSPYLPSISTRVDESENAASSSRANRLSTRNVLKSALDENTPSCSFHENVNDPEVELGNDTSVRQDELTAAEA